MCLMKLIELIKVPEGCFPPHAKSMKKYLMSSRVNFECQNTMLNVERKHILSSFKDVIMFWKIFIICQAPGSGLDLANLVTNLAE